MLKAEVHTPPGLLRLSDIQVRFSGVTAIDGVTVSFVSGAINGLIGPNGAGKTTLLNAICGYAPIASGRIDLDGVDLTALSAAKRVHRGVMRGFQTVRLLERESVFDNVLVGCERFPQPDFFSQVLNLPAQRRSRSRDIEATGLILARLGLEAEAHRPVGELAFATRRLTEIARILVVRPAVLLLDEPAAGLDIRDRQMLARTLSDYHAAEPFTMIVIEHDVELVRRLCGHAIALQMGRVIAEGAPDAVLSDEAVKRAYFGSAAYA
jgi:branched-chain amino acid transport system ATP-binding protein